MKANNYHRQYLVHLVANLAKALYLGGKVVENKAQDYSPVYTGTMMRSVTTTPARKLGGNLVVHIGPGPEAPYAKYTELDEYMTTKSGKKKELGEISQAKGAKMPWLRPALRDSKDDIEKLLSAAIVSTR